MTNFEKALQCKAVVIGGSAGSFQVLSRILSLIPDDFCVPIIICCHRLKHIKHGFVEALNARSLKSIVEPDDKDAIKQGKIYLAPANYHLSIELGNTFSLSTEEMVNCSRPSIDITFKEAAQVYKEKLIGILLTGANKDGALGVKRIAELGGVTIVQDPKESYMPTMPAAAISISPVNHILTTEKIIEFLLLFHTKKKNMHMKDLNKSN